MQCNDIAAVKVAEISAFLQKVLDEDAERRTKVPQGKSKREFQVHINCLDCLDGVYKTMLTGCGR